MKKALLYLVALLVVVFLGGIVYYTQFYTRTPEYTVTILRNAYEQRNVYLFTKHVDVASVTKNYVIRDIQQDPAVVKPVPETVLATLLANAVSSTEGAVHSALLGDTEVQRKGEKNPLVDKLQSLIDHRLVLKITHVRAESLDDRHCLLYVTFVNMENNEQEEAIFTLQRQSDRTWVIMDIKNAQELHF